MKKAANITTVICAILFFAVLMIGTLLREKEVFSYYENRNYATLPEMTSESILDGSYFSGLEKYLCDHGAGRKTITKLSTALDIYVLKRPVVNDVVIQDDILLPYMEFEEIDENKISAQATALANNLEAVSTLVKSYGGTYTYAAVPCQYAYFEEEYPWYLNSREEYTDLSISVLRDELRARGVDFFDLGAVYDELGKPPELSSKVDNHFSLQGAYVAYKSLLGHINSMGGEIPILSEDELVFAPAENYYMGSRTRKIFNLIKNDEKLYYVNPANPVTFTRRNYGVDAYPVLYKWAANPYEPLLYTFYMGGDMPITEIYTNREELPTVLLYGDSFTNAMECILYLSCDAMYSIDMRHYTDGTLSQFIEEHRPDHVICLRDYEALLLTEANGGT